MKRKEILVLTDFSEISEAGIYTAVNMAMQTGAKLNLLNIIDGPAPPGFKYDADLEAKDRQESEYEHYMFELTKTRQNQLKDLQEQLKKNDIMIQSFIEFGRFKEGLRTFLESHPMDLVVMGTSGETSLSELFSGNHASRAIRIANIPVLAVKEFYAFAERDKILLLVDLKHYSTSTVEMIKNFTRMFDMKVLIAHVNREDDPPMENVNLELEEFAKENEFQDYSIHIIGEGKKSEKIQDFADNHQVALIATISEGNSGLVRLFLGSDTENIMVDVGQPLLSVTE